ncbi:MAG: AMP-binding protein [Proteobacteria bacterium]|nr:AMP-binding protein [Pseudomonadota bacterium]
MDAPQNLEYFPTLSEDGRKMLEFLREHPAAPIYRNQSGNRLLAEEVESLRHFEREVRAAKVGWPCNGLPDWLEDFVATTWQEVPYYRALGSQPRRFADIPTVRRADLAADIARFVPDSVAIDRLINFRTTGTSGNPLLIASHPLVAGRYLAFHKRALARFGIELKHGRGQVGVVLLGVQKKCFTYVSVTPLMDESGLAKINLHPDDWRQPDDRVTYLEALAPEVIAGDPISFAEILNLPVKLQSRALLSVGMMLSAGLRAKLEERFACPVLDLYSLNEVGPVGVFDVAAGGHVLLQNRLFIEILDPEGQPVATGERGEITLTGGFNFCLPLLRYRTGDYAALAFGSDAPVLIGLAGRQPVRFRTTNGDWINNIDVTHALKPLPLAQYGLHQNADSSLVLRLGHNSLAQAEAAHGLLKPLFGDLQLQVEAITGEDKILQYTSDLEHGAKSTTSFRCRDSRGYGVP